MYGMSAFVHARCQNTLSVQYRKQKDVTFNLGLCYYHLLDVDARFLGLTLALCNWLKLP